MSKFHLNMFQYSVGGAVMSDAIIYGQDCMVIFLWVPYTIFSCNCLVDNFVVTKYSRNPPQQCTAKKNCSGSQLQKFRV